MIPEGWKQEKLRNIIDTLEAGASVNGEDRPKKVGEIGVLKVSAVTYGIFDPSAYKTVLPTERHRVNVWPRKGSIIVSRSNTSELVGASAYISDDYNQLFLPDKLWLISSEKCSTRWLGYVVASAKVRSKISGFATGTSRSMKNISQENFLSIEIVVPPLDEQRRIAEILGTWDEAITLTERLIAAKQRRKKALMQQLLTGSVRLPGFEGEWQEAKLGDVFQRVTRQVKDKDPKHVLSITAGVGFVDQREKFGRVIAGKNLEKYVLLRKGEFSYNKGNSKTYSQGCIYLLEYLDEGAVPNVFYSFRAKNSQVVNKFYKFYFEHGLLNRHLMPYINAGVRNDGLLNFPVTDFFKARILLPPKDEQRRIAEVLQTCDTEIELLQQKLAALRRQKQGLMQKLLTGQVRV